MSIKGYKILLAALILVWASLCFVLFGQNIQMKSTLTKAEESISITENFFDQYSKQIKFKLGQWVYNYQLKNTKGVEFDDQSFMDSEFDLLAFYAFNPERPYAKEWSKSKDFTEAELPGAILEKIQKVDFTSAKEKPYIWMSALDEQGQPYVVMAFAVDEAALGSGLVVGVMDMEYLPYSNLSSHTVVLDNDNRFLLHPQKEYLAQKSSMNLGRMAPGELFVKDSEYWLIGPSSKKTSSRFVYNEEKSSLIYFIGFPLLVLVLGLALLSGFQAFLHEDSEIDKEEDALAAKDPVTVSQSDIDFAGYESVLKVQSIREKLNKMILLSSSLKGRLDLAVMGDFDQQLLDDLQSDFSLLDVSIDEVYREASELGYEEQDIVGQITKTAPVIKETESKKQQPAKETAEVQAKTNEKTKVAAATVVASPQVETKQAEGFAFEISEADIDLDFADSLSLHKSGSSSDETIVETQEEDFEDDDSLVAHSSARSTVVKESTQMYNSTLVSESLEEAKSALSSLDMNDEDNGLIELNDLQTVELTPTPGSVEFKGSKESKNDWSKVIEELTLELNNLDLDFVDEEVPENSVSKKVDGKDKITPPRVEL